MRPDRAKRTFCRGGAHESGRASFPGDLRFILPGSRLLKPFCIDGNRYEPVPEGQKDRRYEVCRSPFALFIE